MRKAGHKLKLVIIPDMDDLKSEAVSKSSRAGFIEECVVDANQMFALEHGHLKKQRAALIQSGNKLFKNVAGVRQMLKNVHRRDAVECVWNAGEVIGCDDLRPVRRYCVNLLKYVKAQFRCIDLFKVLCSGPGKYALASPKVNQSAKLLGGMLFYQEVNEAALVNRLGNAVKKALVNCIELVGRTCLSIGKVMSLRSFTQMRCIQNGETLQAQPKFIDRTIKVGPALELNDFAVFTTEGAAKAQVIFNYAPTIKPLRRETQ